MKPTTAFIIFVMTLLLCFCAIYYAFLFFFELEALNSAEVVSSAELALANFKYTIAMILSITLGFAVLFTFGFWIHTFAGD